LTEDAGGLVHWGIGGLALLVAAAIVAGFAHAGERNRARQALLAAVALAAWLAVTGLVAARGLLSDFAHRPPPMLLLLVASFGLAVAAGLSPAGGRLARGLPLAALVGFHAFRLPLELVMHAAATRAIMPPQMSFGGDNFDIVTGITAILVAALAAGSRARALVWAWNVLGLALLATIVVIAILSMPPVHHFGSDARHLNTWFAEFPYVWLPSLLAPSALFGHVVLTRRLLADRAR
jgi:hypothetical protein